MDTTTLIIIILLVLLIFGGGFYGRGQERALASAGALFMGLRDMSKNPLSDGGTARALRARL
jgi:hypothetical protein